MYETEARRAMFDRTQNADFSLSTRCLDCLMPLGSAFKSTGLESENQISAAEANHLCPERVMAELRSLQSVQPETAGSP
jgi:hypothetical protein